MSATKHAEGATCDPAIQDIEAPSPKPGTKKPQVQNGPPTPTMLPKRIPIHTRLIVRRLRTTMANKAAGMRRDIAKKNVHGTKAVKSPVPNPLFKTSKILAVRYEPAKQIAEATARATIVVSSRLGVHTNRLPIQRSVRLLPLRNRVVQLQVSKLVFALAALAGCSPAK